MSLEEVIKRSTIEFLRPQELEAVKFLLSEITKNLPGRINYQITQYKTLLPESHGFSEHEGTVILAGMIVNTKNPTAFDSFQTVHSREETSEIKAIRFNLIPGYNELSDYREEVVKLWDDTRKIVEKFYGIVL